MQFRNVRALEVLRARAAGSEDVQLRPRDDPGEVPLLGRRPGLPESRAHGTGRSAQVQRIE